MIMENIVGTQNRSFDATTINMSLYELLKSGEYKKVLVPNYFPEVQYMESDNELYMRSTHYMRIDESPVNYWFFTFDDKGNYMGEATSGFIRLEPNYSLLHISGTKSNANTWNAEEMWGSIVRKSIQNLNIIGAYDLSSNKYKVVSDTKDKKIISSMEYDDDGTPIERGSYSEIGRTLYVPADDTASPFIKSAMNALVEKIRESRITIPD